MQAIRKAALESPVFARAGVREFSFRIGMYQLNLRLLVGLHLDNEESTEEVKMVAQLKELGKGLRKTMVSATRSVCEGSSAGEAKLKGLVKVQSDVAAERGESFKQQVIEALLKVLTMGAVSNTRRHQGLPAMLLLLFVGSALINAPCVSASPSVCPAGQEATADTDGEFGMSLIPDTNAFLDMQTAPGGNGQIKALGDGFG